MTSPLKIVPFGDEHAQRLAILDRNGRPVEMACTIRQLVSGGDFRTILAPEGIVMVLGVTFLWPGVGEAWAGPTGLLKKYPLAACKAAQQILRDIAAKNGLHRVQASVLSDFARARRSAELMGFEWEGHMKAFGPNREDFERYARWF